MRRSTTGENGFAKSATAYFTESVSHQAGVHTDEAAAPVCSHAPARAVCARAIMNALVAGLHTGLAHGPLDRLRGLPGGHGHEHVMRHDLDIGAADRKTFRIEGVRERHLYRWIVLVRTMRRMFWGLYVSWDTDNADLVLSHRNYDGTSIADNNDGFDLSGIRVHDLREHCGSALVHAYCGRELRRADINGHAPLKWHHDHAAQDQKPLLPVLSHKPAVLALLYYCRGRDSWS